MLSFDRLGLVDLLPPAEEAALASRGWQRWNRESADLLVSYEVDVTTIVQVATPDSEERSRAIASLSVALSDPESRVRLWVGFLRADVNPSLSREQRGARLESELKRLFNEFPP